MTFKFVLHPGDMPGRILIDSMALHGIDYEMISVQEAKPGTPYFITTEWFDHEVDYFAKIPKEVFDRDLKIIMYYHEGDNPLPIQQRLDGLCKQYSQPMDRYQLISANTLAKQLDRCCYFNDHEIRYWLRNRFQAPLTIPNHVRPYEFTVLSRFHKSWRATVITDLKLRGLLKSSQWSYNSKLSNNEPPNCNPFENGAIFEQHIERFLAAGPYTCDNRTSDDHNDHSQLVPELFTQSYCSIVLETFFNIENTGHTFLTEKTYKCIKHGHPFVLVAPPGSLQLLRDHGYRTFDHAIDNTYDTIMDPTQRWLKIVKTIEKIRSQDMHVWFESCRADLEHNQQLFCANKAPRLNTLLERLQ